MFITFIVKIKVSNRISNNYRTEQSFLKVYEYGFLWQNFTDSFGHLQNPKTVFSEQKIIMRDSKDDNPTPIIP